MRKKQQNDFHQSGWGPLALTIKAQVHGDCCFVIARRGQVENVFSWLEIRSAWVDTTISKPLYEIPEPLGCSCRWQESLSSSHASHDKTKLCFPHPRQNGTSAIQGATNCRVSSFSRVFSQKRWLTTLEISFLVLLADRVAWHNLMKQRSR